MKHHDEQAKRAQTHSRAARKPIDLEQRLAVSPREFAVALGKWATFGYRAIYRGWVKPIADCGRLMIPISEVHRFLARTVEYSPQAASSGDKKRNGGEA